MEEHAPHINVRRLGGVKDLATNDTRCTIQHIMESYLITCPLSNHITCSPVSNDHETAPVWPTDCPGFLRPVV